MTTTTTHHLNTLIGTFKTQHDGTDGYGAVCVCGYAPKAKATAAAAVAAVAAHVAKATK